MTPNRQPVRPPSYIVRERAQAELYTTADGLVSYQVVVDGYVYESGYRPSTALALARCAAIFYELATIAKAGTASNPEGS